MKTVNETSRKLTERDCHLLIKLPRQQVRGQNFYATYYSYYPKYVLLEMSSVDVQIWGANLHWRHTKIPRKIILI